MSRRNLPYGLIFALWVAEIASAFESAMILAALKALIADFGDAAKVGWLITSLLIVGTVSAAIVGRLGDLYGRRRCLVIVMAIAAIGSLISAFSTSFEMLLFGRILQGATGAVLALSIGILRENMGPEDVPAAIGLMFSGAAVGTALGLVAGGFIVDNFNWHGIFFASAALCVASVIAILWTIPVSPTSQSTQKVDWVSGLLFAPGVTLMLIYISSLRNTPWNDPFMASLFVAGLLMTAWWWRQSLRSENPLIAVSSFSDRTIAICGVVGALVALGALQIVVVYSLLMQSPSWTGIGLGLTATTAGLVKLPSNITATLAGPLGGWLAGRGGGRIAMVIGGLITVAGWIWALFDTSSALTVGVQLVVIAFGTTMLFSVGPTIIAQAAPPDRISEISGLISVIRGLFMGIGAQIVTTILALDSVSQGGQSFPSPAAFQMAIGFIIAMCAGAIGVSLLLPRNIVASIPSNADLKSARDKKEANATAA